MAEPEAILQAFQISVVRPASFFFCCAFINEQICLLKVSFLCNKLCTTWRGTGWFVSVPLGKDSKFGFGHNCGVGRNMEKLL